MEKAAAVNPHERLVLTSPRLTHPALVVNIDAVAEPPSQTTYSKLRVPSLPGAGVAG